MSSSIPSSLRNSMPMVKKTPLTVKRTLSPATPPVPRHLDMLSSLTVLPAGTSGNNVESYSTKLGNSRTLSALLSEVQDVNSKGESSASSEKLRRKETCRNWNDKRCHNDPCPRDHKCSKRGSREHPAADCTSPNRKLSEQRARKLVGSKFESLAPSSKQTTMMGRITLSPHLYPIFSPGTLEVLPRYLLQSHCSIYRSRYHLAGLKILYENTKKTWHWGNMLCKFAISKTLHIYEPSCNSCIQQH